MEERTVAIGALVLDGGQTLPAVQQHVTIYGPSNARTVLCLHALTGDSRAAGWWPRIVGDNALFDPRAWRIVGINALGSCYGSTGPANRCDFPRITVRDIVRAQHRALDELGIERLDAVIGGSLGGMQALQWALDAPDRVGDAIAIGAHDHHSAMGIALNAVQREALALDPARGVRLARKIATITYKSDALLNARHDRRPDRGGLARFDVEGYLDRQADLFQPRMDAATYASLAGAMDSFDVRDVRRAPEQPSPRITLVGIGGDWLFRPQDVRLAARRLRRHGWNARYLDFASVHGHDAFLAESPQLAALLRATTCGSQAF